MNRIILFALAGGMAASAQSAHLSGLKQLTHGGQNAEAYWSPDGKRLIFQTTRPPYECDQMFVMNADGIGPASGLDAAKAAPPAAIFWRITNISCTVRPTWRAMPVRRRPTAAKGTCGASLPATIFFSRRTKARSRSA